MQHHRRTLSFAPSARSPGPTSASEAPLPLLPLFLAAALATLDACAGTLASADPWASAPEDGDGSSDADRVRLLDALPHAVVPGAFVGMFVCGADGAPTSVFAQTSPAGDLDLRWISAASTRVCHAAGSFRVRDERVFVHGLPAGDCARDEDDAPPRTADVIAVRHVDDQRLVFGPPGFELTCRRPSP